MSKNNIINRRALLSALVLNVFLINKSSCYLTQEQLEKTTEGFRKSCMGKTGVELALVERCRKGDIADDPKLKCYIKCVYSMSKCLDKQGKLSLDMFIKQIPLVAANDAAAVKLEATMRKCHEKHGDSGVADLCELSYNFASCAAKDAPDVFFFP